jgi:hypothetical protein
MELEGPRRRTPRATCCSPVRRRRRTGTAEAFLDRLAALDPGPLSHLRTVYETDADIVRF